MLPENEMTIGEGIQFAITKHIEGDFVSALNLYNLILKADPFNGTVLHLMAMTAVENGNIQLANALQQRTQFLGIRPVPYYDLLGQAYSRMKICGKALKQHELATSIHESHQLSIELLNKNMPDAAEIAIRRAQALFPDSPDIEDQVCKILWTQGKFNEAKSSYIKALKLKNIDPRDRDIRLLPVLGMKEYCKRNGCKYMTIVEENKTYFSYKPEIFVQKVDKPYAIRTFPELYLAEIKDVIVVGENPSIISENGKAIFDMAVHKDSYRYEFVTENMKHCGEDGILFDLPLENTKIIETGVMLIGSSSGWGHWLFEILPRFYLLNLFDQYKDVPLLIDEASLRDPHNTETLKWVNETDREIILLKKGHRYLCKKLICPSQLVHIPQELKAWTEIDVGDDLISPHAVKYLRKKFYLPDKYKTKNKQRLYIPRFKGRYRRLVNETEIWPIFERYGFTIIQPEKVSFEEKLKVFMNAEIIGGVGSSGFINHIFSPPDTVMMHIISEPWKTSCFFPNICSVTGQKTIFLFGKTISGTHSRLYHCDFSIDPQEVEEALKSIVYDVQRNDRKVMVGT